jgi:hypothetical protein
MVEGSGNSRFVIWKYYCIERSEFVLGMGAFSVLGVLRLSADLSYV